jgi:transposase
MRGARDDLTDVINDNAKPERARHGELLTGPERRRRWPLREKLAIVAESFEDGAVVSHVAQRHGIKPQQLFDWRRQVREHGPRRLEEAPVFAPVIIAGQSPRSTAAASGPEPAKSQPAMTVIEITIGGAAIRLSGPVDAKALTAVLRAVKALETHASGRTS